jgi:hypothetical protein
MSRYLIPSLALAGVELVVLIEVIRHILPKYRVPVFALLALFIVAHGIWSIRGLFQDLRTKGRTQLAVYETIVNNYPNVPVAGYYTTSSPYYALDFGQIYSGSLYRPVLKQLYPNQFFYNPWTGKFTDFSGPVTVEQVKGNGSWFILTGCSLSDPDFKIFLPPKPVPDQLQIESILEPVTDNPGLLDCGAIYKATTR